MNVKLELVAMAVRILAAKNLVSKPDAFTELFATMFGAETYDKRMAADIIENAEKATAAVKRMSTNRKFKKIVKSL